MTIDKTELYFVGFESDMVHRLTGRNRMFPEHRLAVGPMWVAALYVSLLHVLHEPRPRDDNPFEQAQLDKNCEWIRIYLCLLIHVSIAVEYRFFSVLSYVTHAYDAKEILCKGHTDSIMIVHMYSALHYMCTDWKNRMKQHLIMMDV